MECMGNKAVFSKVAIVTVLNDSFTGQKMHFRNGTALTAISPHYMIIFNKSNVQTIQAWNVKVGDIIFFGYENFSQLSTSKKCS